MAKKSAVNRNERVKALVKQYAAKRAALKAIANDESLPLEERFEARLKLAELPRNSSKTRIRNRCEVTGRPRAYYRKLKMSRISLRDLGSARADPRPRQVELVGGSDNGQRPHRRSDRPHQERRHAQAARKVLDARLEDARARPRRAAPTKATSAATTWWKSPARSRNSRSS